MRVTNIGSDMGSITPMLDQIERHTGALPKVILADANHAKHECIERCTSRGVDAVIPIPSRSRDPGSNADQRCAVAAWHARMKTERAKQLLRARSSLCELTNAHLKHHHGVVQVLVRGLHKVTCVAMLAAHVPAQPRSFPTELATSASPEGFVLLSVPRTSVLSTGLIFSQGLRSMLRPIRRETRDLGRA